MTEETPQESPRAADDEKTTTPLQRIDQIAPKGWRMKVARAALQLIGGSEKVAGSYGEIRDRLDTWEGRSIVAKGMAQAVLQQAVADPEMMERAKARFLGSTLQKQENLEAVVIGVAQAAPPAPAASASDGDAPNEEPADEAAMEDQSASQEPLDADWAADFSGLAENANSDELRQRLSRVLAGELASPGTYSRATIRQIAELDKSDLEAMQKVLDHVFDDVIIRITTGADQVPTLDSILRLADAGLVAEASGLLSRSSKAADVDSEDVYFKGRSWAMKVILKKGQSFNVPITQLTRTGVAVVDLLGRPDERAILLKVGKDLEAKNYTAIAIGRLVTPNQVSLPMEQLYPAPNANVISANSALISFAPPTVPKSGA